MTEQNVYCTYRLVSQHKYFMCKFLCNRIKNSLYFESFQFICGVFLSNLLTLVHIFNLCKKANLMECNRMQNATSFLYMNHAQLYMILKRAKCMWSARVRCDLFTIYFLLFFLFFLSVNLVHSRMWIRNIK